MPYKDKERKKQYYLKNRKKISKRSKERYYKDPEKFRKLSKERYQKKKKSILKYRRNYYQSHKEEAREREKNWNRKNKEKVKKIKALYRERNREKLRKRGREYSTKNRFLMNLRRRKWRKRNPEKVKEEKLKNRFNLTLQDFKTLIKNQKNKCGICFGKFDFKNPNSMKYPCVDHDHLLSKVRGILCRQCNSGIGGFKDNPFILKQALFWVKRKAKNMVNQRIFKMTTDDYKKQILAQSNKCGICRKNLGKITNVDHDHKSGKIRGILCPPCNISLGLLKDNSKIISNAIKWVFQERKTVYESN